MVRPTILVYEDPPIGVEPCEELQFKGLKALCKQAAEDKWQNAPLGKAEAEVVPGRLEATRGSPEEFKVAVADQLKRFLHKGQLVILTNLKGKSKALGYLDGRTGLILKDQFDAAGRYTVELNGFDHAGGMTLTWVRVPAECIILQLGMVPGLFFDNRFEKAAIAAGVMDLNKIKEEVKKKKKALKAQNAQNEDDMWSPKAEAVPVA